MKQTSPARLDARVELDVLGGVERGIEGADLLEDLAAVHGPAADGAHPRLAVAVDLGLRAVAERRRAGERDRPRGRARPGRHEGLGPRERVGAGLLEEGDHVGEEAAAVHAAVAVHVGDEPAPGRPRPDRPPRRGEARGVGEEPHPRIVRGDGADAGRRVVVGGPVHDEDLHPVAGEVLGEEVCQHRLDVAPLVADGDHDGHVEGTSGGAGAGSEVIAAGQYHRPFTGDRSRRARGTLPPWVALRPTAPAAPRRPRRRPASTPGADA